MPSRLYVFIIALSLFTNSGIVMADEEKSQNKTSAKEFTTCPETRPQMCTREYRPVCAKLEDGSMKTYSNGCTACTDPKVVGHYPGACE